MWDRSPLFASRELVQARESIRTAGFRAGDWIRGPKGQAWRDCGIRSTKWGPMTGEYNTTLKNFVQWNGLSMWNKTD